jgi:hypothetical protein
MWILFVIVLVAAFVAWRVWRIRLIFAAIPVVIVLLFAIGVFGSSPNHSTSGGNSTTAAQTPVDLGPQQPRNNCQDGFYVLVEPHAGNKVSSVQTTGDPTTWPTQVMQIAMHDPAVLQLYWNKTPAGQKSPITDVHQLVGAKGTLDYGCYTAAGRDLWNKMDGAYINATVKPGVAPAVGINTGVLAGSDTPFQEPAGAISGDRTAAVITFQNGTTIWEMKRCKNIVTSSNSPIPGIQTMVPPSTPSVPNTTPTTVPPTPKTCADESVGKDIVTGTYPNCTKHCVSATACGVNGQDSNHPQQGNGNLAEPTAGHTSGAAEANAAAQPATNSATASNSQGYNSGSKNGAPAGSSGNSGDPTGTQTSGTPVTSPYPDHPPATGSPTVTLPPTGGGGTTPTTTTCAAHPELCGPGS